MNKIYKVSNLVLVFIVSYCTACKKFVTIDAPKTSLTSSTVFTSDATATAAVIDIYARMINNAAQYTSGSINALSYRAGLSSDELRLYSSNPGQILFAGNNLIPLTSELNTNFWTPCYQHIFRANAVLEGLQTAGGVSQSLKDRLEGESKFLRAFSYFYLVNLFGDVPLVLTTDYRVNATLPRASASEIYTQIVKDLKEASALLSENYLDANGTVTAERTRVNKFAAIAMLARVYLYLKDWENAEAEATKVIDHSSLYSPVPIADMFLKNNQEAIWQLGKDNGNTQDAVTFHFAMAPNNAALDEAFYTSFNDADLRKTNWIAIRSSGADVYYQPDKYKATVVTPVTEYSTVLRLAEQYLIRAEARAHQTGKVTGPNSAETDLNYIRNRSGLENTNATDQAAMLLAVEEERRFELFTEWGHRWLDLKRTDRANAVLGSLKGSNWQSTDQLWPIPEVQIQNNPAMANQQNPGY